MRGWWSGLSLSLLVALATPAAASGALTVAQLRWDGQERPFGFMQFQPRLEWIVSTPRRGQRQTAYQVLVASSADKLRPGSADLWDSKKVASEDSINVRYGGPTPKARQRAFWTVRVWDTDDRPSPFARPAIWEMGLYDEEWAGMWIGRPQEAGETPAADRSATYLRKTFRIEKPVRRARLYASGFGAYELHLNGRRATEDVLQPGWTDYEKRVLFQAYDVTAHVRRGDNVLGALVAGGWCTAALGGRAGACGKEPPRVMMQLEATLADGTLLVIITDPSWKAAPAPITSVHLLGGETYDARLERQGWDVPGYDDRAWLPVQQYDKLKERDLIADPGPPIRIAKDVRAVSVVSAPRAGWIFDLGQSVVGWPRLEVRTPAGRTVTLRYGQALAPDGSLAPGRTSTPESVDRYTTRGKGVEVWEPRFAVHAFRYVEVQGLPAPRPPLATIVGRVVHSVMSPTAELETSNATANRLWGAIGSSQRGAFLSVPSSGSDRVGALLDAGAFARTACLTHDVRGFFRKWIDDVRDAQHGDAAYSNTAPAVDHQAASPGAAAAGVMVPWAQHLCYDDRTAIDAHMPSMGRWLDHVTSTNTDLVWARDVGQGPGDPGEVGPATDLALIGTAELAGAAAALAHIARHRGSALDSYTRKFGELAAGARAAFARRFVAADGKLTSDTQTAYALAIGLDVLERDTRARSGPFLAAAVERAGAHATTGLLGSAYLLPALSKVGRDDLAYRVLLNSTCPPSTPTWTCDVRQGATTLEPYARGAVGEWMLDAMGGIALDPDAPAGRHLFVRPRPSPEVTWARARFDSLYGRFSTDWRRDGRTFRLRVSVPAGARATVTLPADGKVTESGKPLDRAEGVEILEERPGQTRVRVASGSYDFVAATSIPLAATP